MNALFPGADQHVYFTGREPLQHGVYCAPDTDEFDLIRTFVETRCRTLYSLKQAAMAPARLAGNRQPDPGARPRSTGRDPVLADGGRTHGGTQGRGAAPHARHSRSPSQDGLEQLAAAAHALSARAVVPVAGCRQPRRRPETPRSPNPTRPPRAAPPRRLTTPSPWPDRHRHTPRCRRRRTSRTAMQKGMPRRAKHASWVVSSIARLPGLAAVVAANDVAGFVGRDVQRNRAPGWPPCESSDCRLIPSYAPPAS